MKALFIGGTGNISLYIARQLLLQGWELHLLNRGSKNDLLPGAIHLIADINDEAAVKALLKGQHYDVIAQFITFTEEQTARDIRLFQGHCDQFIFISSASAYHKPVLSPFITESTPLHNPYWQYSRDKIACEELLMKAYRDSGFPVTIVRPSHTYGEQALPLAMHGRHGAWQVLKRILDEKPVLLPGDGTTLWTVTTSNDFAKGFIGLMGNVHAIGEAFHITSDERLTWNQIHQTVARILDRPFIPCYVPSTMLAKVEGSGWDGAMLGDKSNCVMLDNAKIKAFVPGFQCPTRFDQGARISIRNFLDTPALQRADPAFDRLSDQIVALMAQAEQGIAALRLED